MKRYILSFLALIAAVAAATAQLSFAGSDHKVIEIKPEASTGLNMIYVVYDTQGVTATYQGQSPAPSWSKYTNLGGAYAEPVAAGIDGNNSSVALGSQDAGYIIDDGATRYFCWIVNYANHRCDLQSLQPADEQDCDRTRLQFTGTADKITYYTINGAGKELSRDLTISYYTLHYDEDSQSYTQVETSVTFPSVEHSIGVPAPLCDTHFTLTADRFLTTWGMPMHIESGNFATNAVEAHSTATQTQRDNDNEQSVDAGALGGSAPVEIAFSAAVTDAAIFREWQMTTDPTFETVNDRFQQLDLTYTFRDNGNYFIRFVANNARGSCEYVCDTYEVMVGESDLQCPNAFSPNGDGVNDEWKVSYKSIVDFECHIFNRWGQEITSFTDPGRGWDGRYNGKYVPTGVYYYVIKARGSDGRKYNLSGDINIIKSKRNIGNEPEE